MSSWLPADPELAVLVQPRDRPFDDPALFPEPRAMRAVGRRDLRLDAPGSQLAVGRNWR
jgi:hypothetical protein